MSVDVRLLSSGDRSSPQLGAANEHYVVAGGIQSPVVAVAWVFIRSRDLHKAFVEREVMSDGILPALLVLSVVWEVLQNIVVYAAQCELPLGTGTNRHHDQSVVRKWRFLLLIFGVRACVVFSLLFVHTVLAGSGRLGISVVERGKRLFEVRCGTGLAQGLVGVFFAIPAGIARRRAGWS